MSTLPPDEAERRAANLRAVYASMTEPAAESSASPTAPTRNAPPNTRGRWGLIGTLAAGALFLLGKLKFLGMIAGLFKLKTLGTMLLSVAVYATEWGWAFAAGFVLMIFIHEAGHAIAMHREGIPASAPVFIPFVGAFIAMRGQPRDAYVEAKVAIGGPLVGSLAAWGTLAAGLWSGQGLLVAVGHVGVLLNLFNLIPVSPLDGGRIAGVFTRPYWIAGYAIGIASTILTKSGILLLVMLVGLITLWQRLRRPVPGYHDVPRGRRLAMGLAYLALAAALWLTMPLGASAVPGR